jgi:signal transduction histidine kinase
MTTEFATAERLPVEQVRACHDRLVAIPMVGPLLESFPGPALVLNRCRQAVLVNRKLTRLVGRAGEELLGMRPGEIVGCVRAGEHEAGCGTTRFCRYCGAVRAILASQAESAEVVEECRIVVSRNGAESALDLRVWATPIELEEPYTVFAIQDISDEKRRAVLERMFFHDILNLVSGLSGLVEAWPDLKDQEDEILSTTQGLVRELVEQIQAGRALAAAERGDLDVQMRAVEVRPLLMRLRERHSFDGSAAGKRIVIAEIAGEPVVFSDEVLLARVLGNLVKNALEASKPGETVTIRFENGATGAAFSVHNPGVISEEVRCQLFQRSFSTKPGRGRGIGLYSVKLLAERYLGGSVSFCSSPEQGTVFTVTLPAA